VLLIGASGFIGSATATRLIAEGHEVTAVSRSRQAVQAGHALGCARHAQRRSAARLAATSFTRRRGHQLRGRLQDSVRDSTKAAHVSAPAALFAACEKARVHRVIHLSAIGIDRETPSEFSCTKAEGDRALIMCGLEWVILRPSVVVGRGAYGGSALLRGLAFLPVVPRVPGAGKLQIVQLDDVVATIVWFLQPDAPVRVVLDLAGPNRLAFDDVVAAYRQWLGWKPARRIAVPRWLMAGAYWLGDFAG
jgi:uncharacterized protein YbjT (DUF2867 family)